jgi:hypothetical protein
MLPADEITKSLPPERDDEPPSLRQDIVDEILDHLQCGLRRELLVNGSDEATAKQRVLNKFGDPRQVARKLWFQAMWSKIMTQRLVVASSIVSMVVSVALVGMVGWMIQQMQSQQFEQQKVNMALIEQLTRLIPQPGDQSPTRENRLSSLKVKVTHENDKGTAAEGFRIMVEKIPQIGSVTLNLANYDGVIDASAIADCGYVESGWYFVRVLAPWGEYLETKLTIHPGRDHLEAIVAPEGVPDLSDVAVSFTVPEWPEHIAEDNIAIIIDFERESRDIAGRSWKMPIGVTQQTTPTIMLLPHQQKALISLGHGNTWMDIPLKIKDMKWEPIHDWGFPAGEYKATFGYIRLTGIILPGDQGWKASDNLGWGYWNIAPTRFIASNERPGSWEISLPYEVTSCLRNPSKLPTTKVLNFGGGGMGGGMMGGGGMF